MMSDDGEFDPNVGVPLWLNVVVPIVGGVVFIIVLLALFFTDKEIPVETLERWVDNVPLLAKIFKDDPKTLESDCTDSQRSASSTCKVGSARENRAFTIDKYDSISSLKKYGSIGSQATSACTDGRPYFHNNRGTVMSFESSI